MVNRTKWHDFKLSAIVEKPHKQHANWTESYSQFTCPYNCNHAVELPTSIVKNNKSTECHKHLMKCDGIAPGGHKAEDDPRIRDIRDIRDAKIKCTAIMHQARLSTHGTSGIAEETHDTRKNRDEETSSVTARASWSQWQIGKSFDQQASGRSNGVTELRCMVTCPDCGEGINVTAASAKKNLSLTARQHQKRCARSTTAACVALPASGHRDWIKHVVRLYSKSIEICPPHVVEHTPTPRKRDCFTCSGLV